MKALAAGLLLAVVVAVGAPASAADPPFGTAPVSVPDTNIAPEGLPQLVSVDVGQHDGFDRVVFQFSSAVPGYNVSFVPEVRNDPSDQLVPLEGTKFLVVAMHSVASAQVGAPPAPQGRQSPRFTELREIAGAGDFEGVVSFGLGLTTGTGFRVFTLTDPDRIVVDVQHGTLAATGSNTRVMSLAAVLMLVAGVVILIAARSRDSD